MAVSNAWATGHTVVPLPKVRHSETLNPFSNKYYSIYPSNKLILRTSKNSKLSCHCTNNNIDISYSSTSSSPSMEEWDWNRWTRHFSEIEQAENYASVLKFQLEDAIENEDFKEAAKLKAAIEETTLKDSFAEILSQLKNAIDEERYRDASKLCQSTGSGLVGWWVGYSKDSDDPFGRLIRISPGTGRLIGRSYSPRQLVTSSPGTPLFEIYVVKDANETYNMQVVFLKQTKGNSTNSSSSSGKSTKGPSADQIENGSVVDVEFEETEVEKSERKSIDLEGAAEEGIKSVINFLREKIPELKVKVTRINISEDISEDDVKQFLEEDSEEESSDIENNEPDQVSADIEGDSDIMENDMNLETKLYIGGVLHNKEETTSKDEFVRVPADILDMERESFILHVAKKYHDNDIEETVMSKVKVAAIAAQNVAELMPPEVAKAFLSSTKRNSKVSKNVRELIKLAVSQAQKRNKLSEYTNFSRITTSHGDLDPFEGLFVGAFGPYGTEIVQLRRKYGNWNTSSDESSSDVEFFEYVEAVKLTGDLNVPAGQVTFRAKIGKSNRLTSRGLYPDELGVVASYKGQGRIAEFGFHNPKWVEGDLLKLNGKGLGPYVKGADLGFLYTVPEQSFLVLFNRLKLPE